MKTFIEKTDKVDGCNHLSPPKWTAGLIKTQMQHDGQKWTHETGKIDEKHSLWIVDQRELRKKTLFLVSRAQEKQCRNEYSVMYTTPGANQVARLQNSPSLPAAITPRLQTLRRYLQRLRHVITRIPWPRFVQYLLVGGNSTGKCHAGSRQRTIAQYIYI